MTQMKLPICWHLAGDAAVVSNHLCLQLAWGIVYFCGAAVAAIAAHITATFPRPRLAWIFMQNISRHRNTWVGTSQFGFCPLMITL